MYIRKLFLFLLFVVSTASFASDACFTTDANTIVHWQFNDNLDDSGPAGLTGKAAKAEFTEGKFGKAVIGAREIGISGKKGFEKLGEHFTIKTVFKIHSLKEKQQAIVWKRSNKPRHGFLIQILNSKPLFCFYDALGKQYHIYGPTLLKTDLNRWITLTVSYNGENMVMTIDGRRVAKKKLKNIVMVPGQGYLYIASAGKSRILQGEVDEILITTTVEHTPLQATRTTPPVVKKKLSKVAFFQPIPGALYFNFSSPYAKPFNGFKMVDVNTMYGEKSPYGWIFKGSRGEVSQSLFQRKNKVGYAYPDNLTGTAIHFRGGQENLKFKADIKSGKYIVVLYLDAFADGGKMYNILPYKVYTNGKQVVDRRVTRESFFKDFYREFADRYEWRPGTDIWNKYLKDEVNIYQFPVTVTDGRLELEFKMPAKHFGLVGLLSLNGIIIAPAGEKKAITSTLDDIEQERRRQFQSHYKEVIIPETNPLPQLSAAVKNLGYVPFSRYFMKQVFPNTIPLKSEIEAPLSSFAAQDQRQIMTFSLYPLKTLQNVKVSISDLKSANGGTIKIKDLKIFRVRYIEEPLNYKKIGDCSYMPLGKLLVANKPFTVTKGVTRRYMLEINTPENVQAGNYRGSISIKPDNAPEYIFKVTFKVYPFKLESYADDDERVWIYYPWATDFRYYKGILWDEKTKWQRIATDVAMMKKYSIAPTVGFDWFMTDDELIRFMEIYQKHNFRGMVTYGGYKFLHIVDKIEKNPGKHGNYSAFIKRMKEIEVLRKKYNWPKFAYYTTAEIHNGMPGYLEGKWAIEQMKKAAPEATLFCLPNRVEEFEVMLESKVDIVGPNAISMREDVVEDIKDAGKKLWFYGWGRERFRCGLIGWRLGTRGGLKEWWTKSLRKPLNPYDTSRYFDAWNDAPPYEGPNGVIPTLGLEETTAGRLDFLYLATLELWLQRVEKIKTPAAKQAIAAAKQLLSELKKRVKPDYYFYYRKKKELRGTGVGRLDYRNKEKVFNWPVEDYIKIRRRAANIIVKLKEVAGQ
ncbi:MAG: curli production assembly/transport protein CsgE [Victivallaceae bacterium]|nr:curli production assembly/transport protein CsgE [Victivallaceae bacterium]